MKLGDKYLFQYAMDSRIYGTVRGLVLGKSFTDAMLKLQSNYKTMKEIQNIYISKIDMKNYVAELFIEYSDKE